jgi:hypothetical protein
MQKVEFEGGYKNRKGERGVAQWLAHGCAMLTAGDRAPALAPTRRSSPMKSGCRGPLSKKIKKGKDNTIHPEEKIQVIEKSKVSDEKVSSS